MQYQGPDSPWSKLDHAATAAASLAWLILQQQDAVGLCCYDEQVQSIIRPSSNPSHLGQLLRTIESTEGGHKTSIGRVLHELADRFTRRGIVIIFSDLFDDVDQLMLGIKHLRHRRHDVIVAHTLDAAELDFPFQRPTLFQGLESMPELLVDPRGIRRAYRKKIDEFRRAIETQCRNLQVDYVLVRNDQPLDVTLSSFLAKRKARLS